MNLLQPEDMLYYQFEKTFHLANYSIKELTELMSHLNDTRDEADEPLMIDIINLYSILPIVLLGTIGNLLSIAVFRGTKLRRVSASYYLTMLSISDTGLLLALFASWLQMVGVTSYNQPFLCQFLTYLFYVSAFLSPWLIVIFTVERFVATCYPLKRAAICTVARARAIVFLLVSVALLSYLYIPFMAGSEPGRAVYHCQLLTTYHATMKILNIADTVLTLVVPVILIIVLNIRIAKAIWHFEHVRRRMTMVSLQPSEDCNSSSVDISTAMQLNLSADRWAQVSGKPRRPRKCCTHYQVKITKMLLIISTVFIGLNAPSYVTRIMLFILPEEKSASFQNLHNWFQLGFYLNFAINFLLYCVSGQNFRKSLKSLVWKVCHKTRHGQLNRSNTGTLLSNCNNSTAANNAMAIGLMTSYQPCQTSVKEC